MNKTELLEKINRVADARDAEAVRKENAERERQKAIVSAIKTLAPRISDMLDIAQHLYAKGISIGPKRTLHGSAHSDEFISSWWSHNFGFCYNRNAEPREYPIWVGFINGGACGQDMCVDRDGNIVRGCQNFTDMQSMLRQFDEFERKFYDYVESL